MSNESFFGLVFILAALLVGFCLLIHREYKRQLSTRTVESSDTMVQQMVQRAVVRQRLPYST